MWQKLGIDPKDGALLKDELKLEIHHVADLDVNLETTLQIITKDAHDAAGVHSGSVRELNKLFELINNYLLP